MNTCFRPLFVKNAEVFERKYFKLPCDFDRCIYEVIRVMQGMPLFLDDHLNRFYNSLILKNVDFSINKIKSDIDLLLKENRFVDGNIKIELFAKKNQFDLFSYYVEHHYPSDVEYNKGVALKTLFAERNDPNAKVVHDNIKVDASKILKDRNIYEVLFVNKDGTVTEGSRSNIFFIKNTEIYTAPGNLVLLGITRKYVIQAIQRISIKINEKSFSLKDIATFDAAFLTGTSPMVLSVNKIDDFLFETHKLTYSIFDSYTNIIKEYIKENK